ncbi:hypothetical protein BDP55DRAFT_645646 [Colletotrichum godetiae]|uniref:Uncharacterized protein n=1 Tax=Colletotrichum godetiae TaxID=1209918 RepID=A0AAJ0AXA9_9PEZI|nr:uncharacterized protein BDP55DRAFT_645646 [Colletotrichum godetiae]KAK1700011.1 hypothetical protein BDP55DRAFT_645646 [Colletotrichum godetiae]
MGDRITQDIQAVKANAIFATAGSRYAWERYRNGFINNMGDSNNLVALCRSAETEEQCRETLGFLDPWTWQPRDCRADLWPLLYVHVVESMNHEMSQHDRWTLNGPLGEKLANAVSFILAGDGKGFLLKQGGSVDLFAFHLLDTVNEKYHTLLPDIGDNLGNLLESMHCWVLSVDNRGIETSRALTTLRQCAHWCWQSLVDISSNLDQKRPNIQSAHGKVQKQWKEHHEVYGTLWYILVMQLLAEEGLSEGEGGGGGGGDGGGAGCAEGARNARRDLGISQSEVLSCMCWVIVTYEDRAAHAPGAAGMMMSGYDHLRDDGDDSPEHLFRRVQVAAYSISHAPSRGLWEDFLRSFKRFNDLTVKEGGDGLDIVVEAGNAEMREAEYVRFREEIMAEVVAFVEDALSEFESDVRSDGEGSRR